MKKAAGYDIMIEQKQRKRKSPRAAAAAAAKQTGPAAGKGEEKMRETIYLAGGCFWGTQRYFDCLPGVLETEAGYANGKTAAPSYEQVKYAHTGHAETVKVTFDPERISLGELLEQYYKVIDPTSVNRQGGDVGEQYRTGIYYTNEAQKQTAERSLAALAGTLQQPLAVQCLPLENFYPAEEYHQKYLEKNPQGYCHICPEMFAAARAWRRGEG